MNIFPKPLITSCLLKTPFILKEGCMQLEISIEGWGWLKVEVIENKSKNISWWAAFNEVALSFITQSPLASSILLYKHRDDSGRITVNQFRSPSKTVVLQKFSSSNTYSLLIPDQCQFSVRVSNFWGSTVLASKTKVQSTVNQSFQKSKNYLKAIEKLNQSQILKRIDKALDQIPEFEQEIDVLTNRYLSHLEANHDNVKHFQVVINSALNDIDIPRIRSLKPYQKVPQVDFSYIRKKWYETSAIIHEVKKKT